MRFPPLEPEDKVRLDAVLERIRAASTTLVGYPCNEAFDYSELLPFLSYSLNNVGDPFAETNYGANTHDIEREVLNDYARLTDAKPDETWGYVTNGGTEGNMYGLYLARELLPQAIVYYSEDTHYSVAKSLRVLSMRSIMIRAQESGEMDYDDLRESLRIHRDCPAILFANVGTTMKGGHDDIAQIVAILHELRITEHYIHADAALSGMVLPFVDSPRPWNFAAGIDSISTSGHKMLGSPIPCGMLLARKTNVNRIARSVEYVGVLDTTLTGSRNGFAPLVLWTALKRRGFQGMRAVVSECLSVADYTIAKLEEHGVQAWRNEHSITVVFPRPSPDVIRKWQIAPYKDIGHLIAMPHVSREMVDEFVSDYMKKPADSSVRGSVIPPGARVRLPWEEEAG